MIVYNNGLPSRPLSTDCNIYNCHFIFVPRINGVLHCSQRLAPLNYNVVGYDFFPATFRVTLFYIRVFNRILLTQIENYCNFPNLQKHDENNDM